MSEGIYLKQLEIGPMANYVYLIGDLETREAMIVDPAWDIPAILDELDRDDMKLVGALATHFHPDHIGGSMMGHEIPGVPDLPAEVIGQVGFLCPGLIDQRPPQILPDLLTVAALDESAVLTSRPSCPVRQDRPRHTAGLRSSSFHADLVLGEVRQSPYCAASLA